MVQQPALFFASWFVGIVASLLPDIDSPNALIRTLFGVGKHQSRREIRRRGKGLFARLLDIVQWIAARILDVVDWILPHRGITHWGLTFVGLSLGLWLAFYFLAWPWSIWLAFTVGYGSHLFADGITKAGLPLLAPFRRGMVRLLPRPLSIRTGSHSERVVLYSFVFLLVVYLFGWVSIQFS